MANNQLMVTPEVSEAFKPEVLQVIRTSICPTATDAEFLLFAHKAASYRLDPFKNEIYFIKYGNQARIQFAAEAYLAKAREQEGFQPPDTQMVCENDVFKVSRNKETNQMEVAEHDFGSPRGKIIGAYSIAFRDGYRPVFVYIDRSEVDHMFTGQNKDNWNKWTTDMLGKHVEQRALKKQYGLDFGDDEIQQPANAAPAYEAPRERKDITHEVTETPAQPAAETEDEKVSKARKQMSAKFRELGITDKNAKAEYMTKYGKIKGETPTLAELTALLKVMDLHLEEKRAAAEDDDLLLPAE
ncbi:hypothetical protein J31TS4_18840 [Paenibacillus sp. J31TS4]|uniref:RecT family recombinase n=1 Tax=Paenibacillus sp. J31TS4 TaxID=2807195 RepID=UPI001B0D7AB8|nr:RecT family recombinase [Paenibacillus sp. J31TS4]GIP38604.1 hypothetical protein J31TS4_18840 [Paenibacillus sp. J31TS4]